jgi:hypothetical protein
MPMLDRSWYNQLVNDSGQGKDGTIWRKEDVDSLMDAIDAEIATMAQTDAANVFTEVQEITGIESQLILSRPGLPSKSRLGAPNDYLVDITWNAYWDGTQWMRDDITKVSYFLGMQSLFGGLAFVSIPPGPNPIPVTLANVRAHFAVRGDGRISERQRLVPLGEWADILFNAAHFAAQGGGAWTVDAAAVPLNRLMLIGTTLFWRLHVGPAGTSVVSGTVTGLVLTVPDLWQLVIGQVARLTVASAGATKVEAVATVISATTVLVTRVDGAAWPAGVVNLTGTLVFEMVPPVAQAALSDVPFLAMPPLGSR